MNAWIDFQPGEGAISARCVSHSIVKIGAIFLIAVLIAVSTWGTIPPSVVEATPGTWSPTGSLSTARDGHTATLLPDGRLLVAGGSYLTSAEVYDRGLGFDPTWRPAFDSVAFSTAGKLQATGSGWRGYNFTEASSGAADTSASNYPLVQLRRIDNEQVRWLLPDLARPFSATTFTSQPLTGFPQGPVLVTVFVNGLPSLTKTINYAQVRLYLPRVFR